MIIALHLFINLTFVADYLPGGPAKDTKPMLGLGTAQPNVSAALAVGAQNYKGPDVIVMLLALRAT